MWVLILTSIIFSYLHEHHGWFNPCGAYSSLSSSLFAEMWVLCFDILIPRNFGLNSSSFLIWSRKANLLDRTDWTSSIYFSPRETNKCANMLAQCDLSSSFTIDILKNVIPLLNYLLMYDASGSTSQLSFKLIKWLHYKKKY
jgi:hypothetical protein